METCASVELHKRRNSSFLVVETANPSATLFLGELVAGHVTVPINGGGAWLGMKVSKT